MTALVSFSPAPALAQPAAPPPPTNVSDALKQYQDLAAQASKANEDLLAAKNDLATKQADLDKATADLAAAQQNEVTAKADEEKFRGSVDALASAAFQGTRFTNLSALLSGGDQQDFLDRASALNVLAAENKVILDKYTGAVELAAKSRDQAIDAQNRSQEAKTKAETLATEINKTKVDLDARVSEAEKAYNRLSGKDKQDLQGPVDNGVYLAPAGLAHDVVQLALDQVGDAYVYGAAGPNQFDCSGLTMYAYRAAGVGLPHSSRSQYTFGKPVASGEWVAGDLLFYGGSAGSIHHVGMYIGNGKMVHASTSGVPVKVVDAPRGGGGDYLGARRILG
ncbi:C40 family peptidase [Actinophytocola sp.]|uniref:C40 family peptidase n=1 Tax=Actinophytocola sp. TaxID=1872138 RepID=UPI002D7E9580|nr:NlpC/P60 family protein [Actinophytocola sp.]HET9138735.1 NlpC/P60 family protein [Actinophytocola sp.]